MALAVRHQGDEQIDLALGFQHRLMGPVQVIEVIDQRSDPGRDAVGTTTGSSS